ncbi:MAG: class I SAM-dependent methyltransferase [Caryophanon sp.]|nr:class I SAM-dependent methyltransferase [Caryophanon sp.]
MSYITKNHWNEFYKKQKGLNENSTFSMFVFEKIKANKSNYILVDIGCGTGKDSFYFASKGMKVIGIDGSEEVIKINKGKVNPLNYVDFKCVDLSDENEVNQLFEFVNEIAQLENKHVLIYNRFFLHAIPDEVEEVIFTGININLKKPYIIMSEFRTKEDEMLHKIYNDHFRRYVDTNELLNRVLRFNWSVEFLMKERGLSIYKDEDPFLARLILSKNNC